MKLMSKPNKWSLPLITGVQLRTKKLLTALPGSAGSIGSISSDEGDILAFNENRRNSLVDLLKMKLQEIKSQYSSLCLNIRQYRRHHYYIEQRNFKATYDLIIQQRASYILLRDILKIWEVLNKNFKAFCLASEHDTGYEKCPMHYREDILKMQAKLVKNGCIDKHIRKLTVKLKSQTHQTLRVLESDLYSMSGVKQRQSAQEYLLNNITHPIISNFIIHKNNGLDSQSEYGNIVSIITQIISHYRDVINNET